MKRISIDVIKEGMVLEKDVLDDRGNYLLGKGTVLDKGSVALLKIRGVSYINIAMEKKAEEITLEQAEQIRQEIEQEIGQRFLNPPETPMMKALYEAVINETVWERING